MSCRGAAFDCPEMPAAVPRGPLVRRASLGPLPCDSYSNSNSGRGTEPSFIDCAISCTNDPFRGKRNPRRLRIQIRTTAARNGAKAEAEDGSSLEYTHTQTQDAIVNMLNGFSNI